MQPTLLFVSGTGILIWLSRKALAKPGSHGFYRFFSWEAILALIVMNREPWGEDPYSPHQFASWILMLLSIFLVVAGIVSLKLHGKAGAARDDGSFYEFEKTTALVSSGIFAYIRHPMYASLLALTWGAYFQDPSPAGTIIAVLGSVFLFLTARTDERECLGFFGDAYAEYMRRTRRFIPFIL